MYHSNNSNNPKHPIIHDKTQSTDHFRFSLPYTGRTNKSLFGEENHGIKVLLEDDTATTSISGSNSNHTAGQHSQDHLLQISLVSPSPRPIPNMSFANRSTGSLTANDATTATTTNDNNSNNDQDEEHRHKNHNRIIPPSIRCAPSTTATTTTNLNGVVAEPYSCSTIASTANATTGDIPMSKFPLTQNSSNFPVPSNIQEEIPYISVDGRRKRRRTTFEDAFHQCLSMTMHEDSIASTAISNNDNISTPERDSINDSMYVDDEYNDEESSHNDNIDDDDDDDGNDDWNIHNHQGYYSSPMARRYDNVDEVSKKLSYHQHHDNEYQNSTDNDNHLGGTTWTNTIRVSRMSSTDSIPDQNHGQDDDSISSSSTKSNVDIHSNNHDEDDNEDNSVMEEQEGRTTSSLPSATPSTSLLFAPRKGKKHTEYVDPVDQRIEELIRHSRIKAMVMTQRERERQRQQQRAYEKCKMQQMGEKEMDHGGEGGGASGSLDLGSGMELRRKNEQEESYFTGQSTDDSVLPLWSNAGGCNLVGTATRSSSSNVSLVREGPYRSRSNSIPRGMKYSEFMDMEMSDG